MPRGKPASIATNDVNMRIETEIVPGTSKIRKYLDNHTFEMLQGLCVKVERRVWRASAPMYTEVIYVPLHVMGYEKEPDNYSAFENAMKVI